MTVLQRKLALLLVIVSCLASALTACSARHQPAPTTPAVTAWHPKHRYVLPQLTAEEMAARRLAWLKEIASLDRIRPEKTPALVRYVLPEETSAAWVPCMREGGWNVKARGDGNGIIGDYGSDDQAQAYNLALYNCRAMFSINPRLTPPASEPVPPELLRMSWEWVHDVVIPCLAAHGTPATQPLPSMETYVASHGDWRGYPFLTEEQEAVIGKACPQQLPSKYMLGEA